jgi:hypothetical protein
MKVRKLSLMQSLILTDSIDLATVVKQEALEDGEIREEPAANENTMATCGVRRSHADMDSDDEGNSYAQSPKRRRRPSPTYSPYSYKGNDEFV